MMATSLLDQGIVDSRDRSMLRPRDGISVGVLFGLNFGRLGYVWYIVSQVPNL